MTASVISGKEVAADVRADVKAAVDALPGQPTLAVVIVGDDPASQVYVRNKVRQTEECGMRSLHHHLPVDATQFEVENLISDLNGDDSVDGILLQLPLPKGLNEASAIEKIDPAKDVDGLTEASAGRLSLAKRALGDDLSGKHVVVIGRSILVGKPAALLFLAENCTITIAHSRTKDLPEVCRTADIVVPAVGRPQMVKGDWLKPGACVIDVGINRIDAPERGEGKTRLVGDADYESCVETAGSITPVPGGVGPMTIACLLRNTVLAACARRGWSVPEGL
jgi:methylenetetrahydrofolate dehydrogenase (NADP+)/methenyltetrahydrofolate cyclohydrolase